MNAHPWQQCATPSGRQRIGGADGGGSATCGSNGSTALRCSALFTPWIMPMTMVVATVVAAVGVVAMGVERTHELRSQPLERPHRLAS